MAEFGDYGEIISRCIGCEENEFISAYFENIQIQNDEVIESSIVANTVVEFMEKRYEWEGSATELYSVLTSIVVDKNERLARSNS